MLFWLGPHHFTFFHLRFCYFDLFPMTSVDPHLQHNWPLSDRDNHFKRSIKQFSINTALHSFYKRLQLLKEPLESCYINFINQQISNNKSSTEQQPHPTSSYDSDAISFTNHEFEELSGAIMQQCRILKHNNALQCVTIHHSDDDNIRTEHKKFKTAMTSLKHKLLCNHADLTTPSHHYLLTTWSLLGDATITPQMTMAHCVKLHTRDPTPARIEFDPTAQYICVIHSVDHLKYINIISRQHLIHNRITDIDQTELQREGIHIDGHMYPNIFDVQWFHNDRFSKNLFLGVVMEGQICFRFIIIDCKTKRVRRRDINKNHLNCQFLKYPQVSRDVLWGMCNASESKEISIGITESDDIGLEKYAQYYLLRNHRKQSKSWVKRAPNGAFLAHFSGMNQSTSDGTENNVNYRLGVIKIPETVDRGSGVDDSDLTMTFRSKPCGFSISGVNDRNAYICRITQDNDHVRDGLKLGLWIHTVNAKVVDNNPYNDILSIIRRAPAPITVGFRHKPPCPSIVPQRMSIAFWYNKALKLDNDTVCNGMHWLSNDVVVCVIGDRLFVLGQNSGAKWRTRVLDGWMKSVYGNVNRDMRGLVHKFIGFELDYVYHVPDLNHAVGKNNEKTMIDFCYLNESICCVYQDDKQQNKLIVL
eukprot:419519_1